MDHRFCSGGGTPDPKPKHAEPPEPCILAVSSRGTEPGCVSMNSEWSIDKPPEYSSKGEEPCCASKKRVRSKSDALAFSSGQGEPSCASIKRFRSNSDALAFSSGRGEPSYVSMKSDWSMKKPPEFSSGGGEPTCMSMKSDWSMKKPPEFSSGGGEPTCMSMKRDRSTGELSVVSRGAVLSDPEQLFTKAAPHSGLLPKDSHQPVDNVLHSHKIINRHKTSMKNKYESLFEGIRTEKNKTLLNRIYTQIYIIEGESEGVNEEHEVLQMEKTQRRQREDTPINCSDIFKPLKYPKHLKCKEEKEDKGPDLKCVLTKGIAGIGKTVSVQKFILDWAEGKANQDVDFMFVLPFRELNLIKDHQYSLHGLLCDFHPEIKDLDPKFFNEHKVVFIFDGLDESRIPLNFLQCEKVSDITMISSVGVLMTNLISGELLPSSLIWITCRPAAANQIPPKHINRVTEIQGFNDPQKEEYFRKRISDQDQAQKIISHIKTARSLHIMCHIPVFCWISATVLQRIIKQCHTKIPKTLTEMYCYFLRTQTNTKNEKYEEKNERDQEKLLKSNRTELLKLAELAFKQLMKENVMFYEEDLRESGIDLTEATVYSGVFTEIFREECVIYQRKVYCFVHRSFQEFLAAVYVFHCYKSKNTKKLQCFGLLNKHHDYDCSDSEFSEDNSASDDSEDESNPGRDYHSVLSRNDPLNDLLKQAVEKAVKSPNGHLDLFLRFLLGISLESNQRLLQGLLTHTHRQSKKTLEYIKSLIKEDGRHHRSLSTERSINLFLCLSEMKDQSLSREIQEYLKSEKHSEEKLSPGRCSALACMLLTSEEVLEELNLKKCNTSEEGYRRLIPAVTVCRSAVLVGCDLTKASCEALCFALKSVNSPLKELNLSINDLQDSGVELLSAGLKSSHCTLEKLRLATCNLGKNAAESLGSVLESVNSSLKELDLSNNDLQDSGVELLSAGLKSSHCRLKTLRLSGCLVTEVGCSFLASALKLNPSYLRELDLTYNHPGESGVKLLTDLLEDPHFKLEKLLMEHGGKHRMKPGQKKYAYKLSLDPNTAHRRLSLSEENRKVEYVGDQPYPDHPDRFEWWKQVLSAESMTGCCYWEAEWKAEKWIDIAVTYRGIKRKGKLCDSQFGYNNQSWGLHHFSNSYSVFHNSKKICVFPCPHKSNRVGVYLDWPAGTLSFYSISPDTHTPTHMHTLLIRFTEPLYAGFQIHPDSSVCVSEKE